MAVSDLQTQLKRGEVLPRTVTKPNLRLGVRHDSVAATFVLWPNNSPEDSNAWRHGRKQPDCWLREAFKLLSLSATLSRPCHKALVFGFTPGSASHSYQHPHELLGVTQSDVYHAGPRPQLEDFRMQRKIAVMPGCGINFVLARIRPSKPRRAARTSTSTRLRSCFKISRWNPAQRARSLRTTVIARGRIAQAVQGHRRPTVPFVSSFAPGEPTAGAVNDDVSLPHEGAGGAAMEEIYWMFRFTGPVLSALLSLLSAAVLFQAAINALPRILLDKVSRPVRLESVHGHTDASERGSISQMSMSGHRARPCAASWTSATGHRAHPDPDILDVRVRTSKRGYFITTSSAASRQPH
ncbi:hypothetical protein PENSPDRAFT_670439 [Peniophora sp. CONT]|nr:hypothetical protein PENSPDRAFT_670439 [Peniophora sp. CONT]